MTTETAPVKLTQEQVDDLTAWIQKASGITEVEARQIIVLFDQGHSCRFLGDTYGVHPEIVIGITAGYLWKYQTDRRRTDLKQRNKRLGRPMNSRVLSLHKTLCFMVSAILGTLNDKPEPCNG